MPWRYNPRHAPLVNFPCPITRAFVDTPGTQTTHSVHSPPHLHRTRCMPLPTSNDTTAARPDISYFPIDFTTQLATNISTALSSCTISANVIHVHSPSDHIGEIIAEENEYTALTVFQYLKKLAEESLKPERYNQLPDDIKIQVESIFKRRVSSASQNVGDQLWSRFLEGDQHPHSPTGRDLLLGNIHIWGLHPIYHSDDWVLHVANPSTYTA
ncbi:hypothetical protein BDQ12DRAFT_682309 [Crucibulum laeve]|uniref:Uncharacterized protein n=1 Tax=Crucibulum laeve TaxID=68775 RepID=A0A5C3M3N1_9AGAR|nr:hypothetical protein BDQ12DRAFT_682309 [Crucibulum laeve]